MELSQGAWIYQAANLDRFLPLPRTHQETFDNLPQEHSHPQKVVRTCWDLKRRREVGATGHPRSLHRHLQGSSICSGWHFDFAFCPTHTGPVGSSSTQMALKCQISFPDGSLMNRAIQTWHLTVVTDRPSVSFPVLASELDRLCNFLCLHLFGVAFAPNISEGRSRLFTSGLQPCFKVASLLHQETDAHIEGTSHLLVSPH